MDGWMEWSLLRMDGWISSSYPASDDDDDELRERGKE